LYSEKILKRLHVPAEEVVFWDDNLENIAAAQSIGITAFYYDDFGKFEKQVAEILLQIRTS
jgi:FMN phosphatase YigB (HAD superfamily)